MPNPRVSFSRCFVCAARPLQTVSLRERVGCKGPVWRGSDCGTVRIAHRGAGGGCCLDVCARFQSSSSSLRTTFPDVRPAEPTSPHSSPPPSQRELDKQLGVLARGAQAEEAMQLLRDYCHHHASSLEAHPENFPWKALSTTLYLCERRGEALTVAQGLALVDELRARFTGLSWENESVLAVLLRLHAAANNIPACQQVFTYLLHRGTLKSRSAGAFLQLVCRCGDVNLARHVWVACVTAQVPLGMAEFEAFGRLLVARGEPLATLHTLLRRMADAFSFISAPMRDSVIEPWVRLCALQPTAALPATHRVQLPSPPAPLLALRPAEQAVTNRRRYPGLPVTCCPACGHRLQPFRLTSEERLALLRCWVDAVVGPRCQVRPQARRAWSHWMRFLEQNTLSGSPDVAAGVSPRFAYDVLIDGANVGYFGLSAWYATAKAQLSAQPVRHRKLAAQTAAGAAKVRGASPGVRGGSSGGGSGGADLGVDLKLIDEAVRVATRCYGFHRPLIFLHERHVSPARVTSPDDAALVARWREQGWLYCVPHGINDDWCWLHAALTFSQARDRGSHKDSEVPLCVLTNDQMRDHHFQLLHPRAFARWRAQHQIHFRCHWTSPDDAKVPAQRELIWLPPPSYDVSLQADEAGWHLPLRDDGDDADCASQAWLCVRAAMQHNDNLTS